MARYHSRFVERRLTGAASASASCRWSLTPPAPSCVPSEQGDPGAEPVAEEPGVPAGGDPAHFRPGRPGERHQPRHRAADPGQGAAAAAAGRGAGGGRSGWLHAVSGGSGASRGRPALHTGLPTGEWTDWDGEPGQASGRTGTGNEYRRMDGTGLPSSDLAEWVREAG